MTKRKIISIISGLIISSIITGLVYYIYVIQTFEFLGSKWIVDPESEDSILFYTALSLFSVTVAAIILLVYNNKKYTAIGVGLPLLLSIWILFKVGTIYLDKSSYYEPFNKEIWSQSSSKPIKMVRDLIKKDELIGLTRKQAEDKLGNGDQRKSFHLSDNDLVYGTQNGYALLVLEIKESRVERAYISVFD